MVFRESGCPWCDTYESTTLEDPDIVKCINEHFLPVKISCDERSDLCVKYGIRAVPTTIIEEGGKVVVRKEGYLTSDELMQILSQWCD